MNILRNRISDKSGIAGVFIFISLFLGSGYLVSHHQNAIEKRFGFCTMTPDDSMHNAWRGIR